MAATILAVSDNLEEGIRQFLVSNQEGGKFVLPKIDSEFLAIPLMIAVFEGEGWSVVYDFDETEEWLDIEKAHPFLFGYEDGFVD
jgi:hypothetical protein